MSNNKTLTEKNIEKNYENNVQNLYSLNNNSINKSKNNLYFYRNIYNNKNINHYYIEPLALVKLEKYKIFDENGKFLENKKRYKLN